MIIKVENSVAHVARATPTEARWLYEYLSFPDARAKYRRGPVWKRGDGQVHMLSEVTQTFPAGFVDAVVKAAAKDSIKVQLMETKPAPVRAVENPILDWLRDYQLEAIAEARRKRRGVFHHATSAGKTEIMVGLGEVYECRWLILTHRKSLLNEIANRFMKRTGEEVGIIGDGKFTVKRITVATFGAIYAGAKRKLKRVVDLLEHTQGVMVDECHIVPADTFYRVIMSMKNAYFRYGFSGTPFARGDKKSIYTWGALGPIIHRIDAQRLFNAGVSARPKIMLEKVVQCTDVKTWNEAYSLGIVASKVRNDAVIARAMKAKKPCLMFVKAIAHGKALEKGLQARGALVEFVNGLAPTPVREAALRRAVHGDVDILISTVIFQEGIDVPELQSILNAAGGQSVIAALQNVGRGMRRHTSDGQVTKVEFEVYDFRDVGCGCAKRPGKKHRGCKWLEKHSRARVRAYVREGYQVSEIA